MLRTSPHHTPGEDKKHAATPMTVMHRLKSLSVLLTILVFQGVGTPVCAVEPPKPEVRIVPQATPTPTTATEAMELPAGLSPTASPTPTPTPSGTINVIPPLSLRECLTHIDDITRRVPMADDVVDLATVPVDDLARRIRSIQNYLKYRDDLHTSLADYHWVFLESEEVQNSPGKADADTFKFDPPVAYISAISLAVEDEDAYIHLIKVYDEKGQLRDTFDYRETTPRLLRHSLPRREVFHLWRRTTISHIEIEYSRVNINTEARPRVLLYGGITERREYIKTSIYYLDRAREEIAARDYGEARDDLLDARKEIVRYLDSNQE